MNEVRNTKVCQCYKLQITFAQTLQNGKEQINSLSPKEYLDNRPEEGDKTIVVSILLDQSYASLV